VEALVGIILLHIFNLGYMKVSFVEVNSVVSKLNNVEHGLLLLMAAGMIVGYFVSASAGSGSYLTLGFVMVGMCVGLTVVGMVRVGYNVYDKLMGDTIEKELSEFKPAIGTERVV
jgi:hypothetical protein